MSTATETLPENGVPCLLQSIRRLTGMGWTIDAVSDSGSRYLSRDGGNKVRIADHAANEATSEWMAREHVQEIRIDQKDWRAQLDLICGPEPAPRSIEQNYHSDREYTSQTMLKTLDESPAKFEGLYITGTVRDKDTPDRKLGRCLHARVLQPDLFSQLCPMMPDYHLNGNVDKKGRPSTSKSTDYYQSRKAEFERENAGKDVIDADEFALLRDMHNAIWSHEDAHAILSAGDENEVIHRWTDRIKRRCMMDAPRPGMGVCADIKTMTGPPTTLNFAKNAARWRHWIQAPWYLDAMHSLYGPSDYRFLFICVNKLPPHEVAIHELDDRHGPKGELPDMEWASQETERLVDELISRRERNNWSAAWQTGINKVPLPRFVRSRFYDLEDNSDGN